MMSVNIGEGDVDQYLDQLSLSKSMSVACVNSPTNVTLSGNAAAIDKLHAHLEKENIFARKLKTGVAYHSPAMRQIAEEYHLCISSLESQEPRNAATMISSVTGLKTSASTLSQAQYWVDNLVSPVRFADALQYLAVAAPQHDGLKKLSTFVEIGPSGALKRPVNDTLNDVSKGQAFTYLPILSKFTSAIESTLETVGRLFSIGYSVSVTEANQQNADAREWPFLVDTPAYPFDHSQLHWHETRLSRDWRFREAAPRSVLGTRVTDWNPLEPRWRKFLRSSEMPWIEDHVIGDNALFPAAGMINMALEAVRQTAQSNESLAGYRIKEASFMKPIIIRTEGDNEVITQLRQLQQAYDKAVSRFEVTLFTVVDGYWAECSKFSVHLEYKENANEVDGGIETDIATKEMAKKYSQVLEASTKSVDKKGFYNWGQKQGLKWSNLFALAEDIRWDGDKAATVLVNTEPVEQYEGIVHPAVLDSAFQVVYVPASRGASEELPTIIPYKFRNVWVSASGWQYPHTRLIRAMAKSQIRPNGSGIECTINLLSDEQQPLCHIEAIMLPVMNHGASDELVARKSLLHHIEWKPTLSLLNVDQLRHYCHANPSTAEESPAANSTHHLKQVLQSVMQQNLGQLLAVDWDKAPSYMKAYVTYMNNRLHELADETSNVSGGEALNAELESLSVDRPSMGVFVEVAKNLLAIARGEIEASELLLSSSLMQDFYEDLLARFLDRRLVSFLSLVAHQTQALRIIEIGAGQGAMTKLILSVFEQIETSTGGIAFHEYVYTDSSKSNLDKARERFGDHESRMTFKALNLDQENPAQLFEQAGFDLVLAGGALHATTNLPAALQDLRALLKPNGHLIFCDVAAPGQFVIDFGFGVLPDWWSSEGESLVPRHIATETKWNSILRQNDFSGTDLVIRDSEIAGAQYASIIVSTALTPTDGVVADKSGRVLLVVLEDCDHHKDSIEFLIENVIRQIGREVLVIPFDKFENTQINPTDFVVFLADPIGDLLADISAPTFDLIKKLMGQMEQLVWVSSVATGSESKAGIKDGFLRTLRAEFSNKRIISVSLGGVDKESSESVLQVSKVFNAIFEKESLEIEYAIEEGQVVTGRLVRDAVLNDRLLSSIHPETRASSWLPGPPLKLHIGSRGQLDTLHFREDTAYHQALGPTDVEIEAKAWPVNFRDVFSALGRLDDPGFGFDCAGVVTRVGPQCKSVQPGDRVSMCLWDCMRMFPRSQEDAVVKIPPLVSYEDACAIIIPGMTAWHALVELGRLSPGEKILIHSAAGATGQLAVQVAQMLGAEIFATVGHHDKKELLMNVYGIPEDHIFYSRSNNATFAKGIKRMTDGYGVDVVLNSLMGQGLRASWECIAPYGRFIEIGKADINADASLPMLPFANNALFAAVDIRHMIVERPQMASRLLHKVMSMAAEGKIRCPEPLHVFGVDAVEDAFRYIQGGKNVGRAIISIEPSVKVQVSLDSDVTKSHVSAVVELKSTDCQQKFLVNRPIWKFDEHASYLVVGGLGGIGQSILKWMASRGAKYLIAPSRSGPKSAKAAKTVKDLQEAGVTILTPSCDAASWQSLSSEHEEWSKTMPTIRGCINAAMVLNVSPDTPLQILPFHIHALGDIF